MKRLAVILTVLGLSTITGCFYHDRDASPEAQSRVIIHHSCWAHNVLSTDPACPTWVLAVKKVPLAVFWGYKDSEMNRKACVAAREAEPTAECYPMLGF